MKNKLFLTLTFIGLLAAVAFESAAQTQVLSTMEQTHPRLLLLKGEEKQLLQNIEKNPGWNKLHLAILTECDQLLDQPPVERIQIGKRLLDKSREALRRIFQLSYAYRTTGKVQYFKRAEKEMLAISAFEDWNPSHFLDVAEMTMALAIGYDWLYDPLSAESKSLIKRAIIEKGIEPSFENKYNGFLKAQHNWNQVCNAGMTFGALAIAEDEPALAEKVIQRSVKSIPLAIDHSYKPDGAYPEGFSYWGYGTSFNVLFNSAMEKAIGTDFGLSELPGYLKTAGFMQHIVGPTGLAYNWGDSGLKEGLTPAMFWFASKTDDPTLLWSQMEHLENASSRLVSNRILPAALIWGAHYQSSKVKAPKELLWTGQGPSPVAYMRTSWTDPDAIFVGFKTGSPSVNHAHMDVGSFVVDAQGERWAMDFGSQGYNSLESKGVDLWNRSQNSQRWEVFRYNNMAHNTLTFNDSLQRVKGYAKIDGVSSKASNLFAISDLSDLYTGQVQSAKRGVAIVNKKAVKIQDEITTGAKAAGLRWNMLTAAEAKIVNNHTIELTQNGKKMFLRFDANHPIELQTWSTKPTHSYDAENPGTIFVGFTTTVPAQSTLQVSAVLSEKIVKTTKASLADWK
ncbi:heparinase II/III domain-containing protein [Dyadobacter jejuensis]|nr:heparinase II/III family protein [Dyadobacter jejuensis]